MNDAHAAGARPDYRRLLRELDPSALLVPQRLLRRVIKRDRGIGGIGLQVPHRKTYVISRTALLDIATVHELGLNYGAAGDVQTLLLIAEDDDWQTCAPEAALLDLWRLLFHARVDLHFAHLREAGTLDHARLQQMTAGLDAIALEEAYRVLRQENMILPPGEGAACFLEFMAVFLELRCFAPHLLPCYFPAVEDPARLETLTAEWLDVKALLDATRPPGAAPPCRPEHSGHKVELEILALPGVPSSPGAVPALLNAADATRQKGNRVRAAILAFRAAEAAPVAEKTVPLAAAKADLDDLAARLTQALHLPEGAQAEWRDALLPLLASASRGMWPASRRLLYDLQKVCGDSERELFAVDLVAWASSLGRKPIRRAVPLQARTMLVKHLRSAASRLPRVRLNEPEHRRLTALFHAAIEHAEEHLRLTLRPPLLASLQEVGFVPTVHVERLALAKMVDELLDRVVERGFINMGDLRDAISRNQLKLPDVSPAEIIVGDRLLKANRRLSLKLDGVYHGGEIYLRWLQRFSSLLFGTLVGRWLVLYLVLPFGGACATAIFLQEMLHLARIHVHFRHAARTETALLGADHPPPTGIHWRVEAGALYAALGALGVFYLLLLHWPAFRAGVWRVMKTIGKGLRFIFWDAPVGFFHLPPIRAVLDSTPMTFFLRSLLRPVLLALLIWSGWSFLGWEGAADDVVVVGVSFLLAFGFFNSRLGLLTEEAFSDWLVRNWDWLRTDLIPGAVRLILDFFKVLLDRLERIIYTVDEWLRFRRGENRLLLVLKPILGLIWFFLTYLVRVIVNLFVEPTVNPIKHFPAVTVGAKLIIPLIPMWSLAMTEAMQPFLGLALAGTIAGTMIILFPGIFGFAVWEFKENWKLYAANRPRVLKPEMIGSHGETMLRLLKPGFHSGTLPKLHAKLRLAKRRGDVSKAHKHEEDLHHVEESLWRFVTREFIALLMQSRAWDGLEIAVGQIHLATNRIRIEIACPALVDRRPVLFFAERGGRLCGGLEAAGWLARLDVEQQAAFQCALRGICKLAGVAEAQGVEQGAAPIEWKDWVLMWEGTPGVGHAQLQGTRVK